VTLRIRARDLWWRLLYRLHLLALSLLAGLRYLLVGGALLAHRAHTELARHGQVVADTLSAHGYRDATRPRPERYARMASFLIDPREQQ
jgi:hypothetical protein